MKRVRKVTALLMSALLIISFIAPLSLAANAATVLQWPVPGHFALSRGFSSSHGAMDINDANINGANIVAAMGGTIVRISKCTKQHYQEDCTCGGTGTGVVVKGDDNRYYSYAHMTAGSIPTSFVVNKTRVNAGDFLGRVGTTGNSSGPHLHFSIATGKNYLDNRIDPEYETYTNVGTTAFTFSKLSSKMSVSNTDAVIAVSLSKPANNRLVSYGATVYDNNGIALGSTSATSGGQKGVSTVSLWWTVSSSMGITLSPGRTYQFAFWANVSGVTLTSPKYSFTTTGTSDSPYTISYNANGGTGAPASQTVNFDGTLHIPATVPTRSGYTFLGWYAMRNGDQTWYSAGNGWHTEAQLTASGYTKRLYPTDTDFVINNSWLSGCLDTTGFTFYAVWEKNTPTTYTVTYNANGGTGAPASQTKTHDVSLTLSSTKPTRSGYTFLGWATSASATSAAYQPGGSFTTDANTTLYAVWEQNVVSTEPQIIVESKTAAAGGKVTLELKLKNNPGFSVLNVAFIYDSQYLSLTNVENKASALTMTYNTAAVWDAAEDYMNDGILATLTFEVAESAPDGDCEIQIVFMGASNSDFENVTMCPVYGSVRVASTVYGDVNGDGQVTTVDLAMLRKYMASKDPITGESSVAVKAGADCNGDGSTGTVDLAMLRKYLASKDPVTGESSVVLGPK